jgi:hypothetical protein
MTISDWYADGEFDILVAKVWWSDSCYEFVFVWILAVMFQTLV